MQHIVDRYSSAESPYLLDIITNPANDPERQYRNSLHCINRWLNHIGRELRLSHPLTTYTARHSWATMARNKNVPISTISEAMGHDSEKTTRIYLASIDATIVDRANRLLIDTLKPDGPRRRKH